jgi:hypothetical protein
VVRPEEAVETFLVGAASDGKQLVVGSPLLTLGEYPETHGLMMVQVVEVPLRRRAVACTACPSR